MVSIVNISEKHFDLDGIRFAKIYQPLKQGLNNIGIYSIYDTRRQIVNSTKYDEFSIDGTTYGNQADTISAILDIVWAGLSDYDIEQLEQRVDNLEENQVTGVQVYTALVDLPAPETLLVSYKVSNDPDGSKNGYYHWSGSVYIKDAELYKELANFPFDRNSIPTTNLYNFIKDIDLFGVTEAWKISVYKIRRDTDFSQIRIYKLNELGTAPDVAVGTNGLISELTLAGGTGDEPPIVESQRIAKYDLSEVGGSGVTGEIVVDWESYAVGTDISGLLFDVSGLDKKVYTSVQLLGNAYDKTNDDLSDIETSAGDNAEEELNFVKSKAKGVHPFQHEATFENENSDIQNVIIDLEIKGGQKDWRVAPFTFRRNVSGDHYIRLAVYDENDALLTSVGSGGIIAIFIESAYVEPDEFEGKIIDVIEDFTLIGIDGVKMVVDWAAIPSGQSWGIPSFNGGGFDSKIFPENRSNSYVVADQVFAQIPAAEVNVWDRGNTYAELLELREAILGIQMFGTVEIGKDYAIGQIRFNDDGSRNFVGVYEYDTVTGVAGDRVALWDANPSFDYPADEGGRRIGTVTLAEDNSSGITIQLTIDFAKLPSGLIVPSGAPYSVDNFRFAVNLLRNSGEGNIEGSATVVFQVNGVDSQIITPDDYSDSGKPSYCLMYCHGNNGDYQDAGPVTWKTFCKENNIAIITTTGQDESAAPFTTNASGWGNYVQLQRYIALYKYCQDTYNLSTNIILSCGSMGGLVAGQILYNKPFPVTAAFLAGPVPDLSYIFANGGVSRKEPIRNAYGMDAGGLDDANLELFIQGYDWYDLGLVDVSGTLYKFSFPKIYIEVGNGDTTFLVDFGGTAK